MVEDLKNIKISVIIPIYKVEQYLRRCIDSVLGQTHKNLEIILIDDGSPDSCGRICDEYKRIDDRIIVIHKENGGLSDARNAGLDIATGEYIGFVDSDDWIEEYMYELLLSNAKRYNAQMSVGGVEDNFELPEGGYKVTKTTFNGTEQTITKNRTEAMIKFFKGDFSAWDKLYERKLFDNIRFPKGKIVEDEAVGLLWLDKCDRIVYTNVVCYHYTLRSGSITNQSEYGEFQHQKFYPAMMDWYEHCKNNIKYIKEKYPDLLKYAEIRLYGAVAYLYQCILYTDINDYDCIKKLLKEEFVTMYPKIVISKEVPVKNKFIDALLYVHVITGSEKLYRVIFKLGLKIKRRMIKNVLE